MALSNFIDRIRIQNFKGFKNQTFDFLERFTVVIGDNGAGKTALLDALAVMAGTWTKGFDGIGYREIGEDEIRRREIGRNQVEFQLPVEIEGFCRSSKYQLDNKRKSGFMPETAHIPLYEEPAFIWKHTRQKAEDGYRITNADAMWLINVAQFQQKLVRNGEEISLPIIGYYGTDRIWKEQFGSDNNASERTEIPHQKRQPRSAGYKDALRIQASEKIFLSWYKTLEDEWSKFKEPADTAHMKAFKAVIRQMVPGWEEVYFSNREDDLVGFLTLDSGERKWLPFRMLSDGYRNVVGMAADIAYRCIKLNPHLGIEAVKQTPGLVLIDELDLHLHPKWQKGIVDDLKTAFPLVQFVVTTHSPFIVQSLKSEELINLNGEESTATTDPFRQSIEEVAEEEMGVPDVERSEKFQEMVATAAAYFRLIRQGRNSQTDEEVAALKKELDFLESRYNDDPAYVALLKAERNSAMHETGN